MSQFQHIPTSLARQGLGHGAETASDGGAARGVSAAGVSTLQMPFSQSLSSVLNSPHVDADESIVTSLMHGRCAA